VNIFHRVKGFFLHYQDVPEPAIVKTWNVSRMVIQRNKRHQDINIKDQIWKQLEEFLKKERFKDAGF
jgi:parafibromin